MYTEKEIKLIEKNCKPIEKIELYDKPVNEEITINEEEYEISYTLHEIKNVNGNYYLKSDIDNILKKE